MRIGVQQSFALGVALLLVPGLGSGSDFSANPMHAPETSIIRRKLLLPGDEYHGSEVHARQGEKWLGLMRTAGGYRTAIVTLRIATVRDRRADGEKELTGKSVGIVEPGQPVFLLKGFNHLAGRISHTVLDGGFPLAPNSFASVHFAGRKIEIQVLPSGRTEESEVGEKVEIFQVNIKQGERTVRLPLVATNLNRVTLLWAGDLDGDGKIDFLFEDGGYHWGSARLFLSSAAKAGEFVAEVAQFHMSGC